MKVLIAAGRAVDVDVVAEGTAAMADGAAEDQLDGAIETLDLLKGQPIGGRRRMDLGVE